MLLRGCVLQHTQDTQPAKRDELRDVGSEEKKDHVEVIDGASEHFSAEEIKSWEHLIDGQESFVPPTQSCEVVYYHWNQEGIYCCTREADNLENRQGGQPACDQVGDVGRIMQHPCLDGTAEFFLKEDTQVEMTKVQVNGRREEEQEGVLQEVGGHQ